MQRSKRTGDKAHGFQRRVQHLFRSLKTRVAEDDNVLYGQDLLSSFGSTQFAQHPWCVEGKRQRRTLSHGAEEEKD